MFSYLFHDYFFYKKGLINFYFILFLCKGEKNKQQRPIMTNYTYEVKWVYFIFSFSRE